MSAKINGFLEKHQFTFLIIFCLSTFAISYCSPVEYTYSDAFGTFLTSQAIIEHKTIKLDAYSEVLPAYGYRIHGVNGHFYYLFPIGTPLLSTPFVWLANLRGDDMSILEPYGTNKSQSQLQNLLSALTTTVIFTLIYAICRYYLNYAYSFLVTIIFVFGSSLISSLGTALWNLNFEIVFILSALLILVRENKYQTYDFKPLLLGFLLFMAYLCRPTAIILILLVLIYTMLKNRSEFIKLAIFLIIFFSIFTIFSIYEFNHLLPEYYQQLKFDHKLQIKIIYALLFHPSRGLLVYHPFLLIPFLGSLIFINQVKNNLLFWLALIWVTVLLFVVSYYWNWWGGHSFGPRLLTDALPALLLLTIIIGEIAVSTLPNKKMNLITYIFIIFGIASIFINTYQGLFNYWPARWNNLATDSIQFEILNWGHPQFLANPKMVNTLESEMKYKDLNRYKLGQEILPTSKNAVFINWYGPEGNNLLMWSNGNLSKILLKVKPKDYIDITRLNLEITAGTYYTQTIDVLMNGIEIGQINSQNHYNPEMYSFQIEKSDLGIDESNSKSSNQVEIEFVIPDAKIPYIYEPSTNKDTRIIGLSFYKMMLTPVE